MKRVEKRPHAGVIAKHLQASVATSHLAMSLRLNEPLLVKPASLISDTRNPGHRADNGTGFNLTALKDSSPVRYRYALKLSTA